VSASNRAFPSDGTLAKALEKKDRALEATLVANKLWVKRAIAEVAVLDSRLQWTGEAVRLIVGGRVGHPNHHNAWGALVSLAVKRGLLVPTGELVPMRTPKSHARRTPVYFIPRRRSCT